MDKQKKENEVVSPSKNPSGTETSVQKLPGYQSQWTEQIDKIWNDYQNRGPFEFNVNEDALYQQYRDHYIRDGQIAMEDTLGQASALTGGYDNSYAQSVGQQTYNRYLEGLNDIVPELYAMALDRYTQQGNDMLAQYGLLMDRENQDYGRYQDAMSLARSQVDAMLSIGKRPSQDLIDQSGLSKEYVDAILSQFAGSSGGGNGGGGSSGSGRGTGKDTAPKKTDDEDTEGEWPSGINTDRNQNGLKGSAWDYTLNNLDRLLASGNTQKASDYMNQVVGQMNESQFNLAMDKWNKYKK